MTSQWRNISVYSLTLHKPLICIFVKIRAMGFYLTAGLVFAQFFTGAITVADPYMTPVLTCFSFKKTQMLKHVLLLMSIHFCTKLPCPRWFVFIYSLIKIRIYLYIPLVYIHLYYIFIHKYDKYEYCLYVNIDIGSTRVN